MGYKTLNVKKNKKIILIWIIRVIHT